MNFPDTEKKLKSRITSHKSALTKEKRTFDHIKTVLVSGIRCFPCTSYWEI